MVIASIVWLVLSWRDDRSRPRQGALLAILYTGLGHGIFVTALLEFGFYDFQIIHRYTWLFFTEYWRFIYIFAAIPIVSLLSGVAEFVC
jgi:hypothetical protein